MHSLMKKKNLDLIITDKDVSRNKDHALRAITCAAARLLHFWSY